MSRAYAHRKKLPRTCSRDFRRPSREPPRVLWGRRERAVHEVEAERFERRVLEWALDEEEEGVGVDVGTDGEAEGGQREPVEDAVVPEEGSRAEGEEGEASESAEVGRQARGADRWLRGTV